MSNKYEFPFFSPFISYAHKHCLSHACYQAWVTFRESVDPARTAMILPYIPPGWKAVNKGTASPGWLWLAPAFHRDPFVTTCMLQFIYLRLFLQGQTRGRGEGAARCVQEGKCLESLGWGFRESLENAKNNPGHSRFPSQTTEPWGKDTTTNKGAL